MELSLLEFLQGFFTFIFVIISLILGFIIMLKYVKIKERVFLLVGASWILLISPYWPDAISFIMIILLGVPLDTATYLFVAIFFFPLVHITWMIALTDFLFEKRKIPIMIFFISETILFEVVFLYFFFTDLSLVGIQQGLFYIKFADFVIFYLILSIIVFAITGVIFAREYLKSSEKAIRLEGIFLLLAFVTFGIGTFMEVIVPLTEITIVLVRIIIISAAFEFYIAFTLPKWVRNIFLKE